MGRWGHLRENQNGKLLEKIRTNQSKKPALCFATPGPHWVFTYFFVSMINQPFFPPEIYCTVHHPQAPGELVKSTCDLPWGEGRRRPGELWSWELGTKRTSATGKWDGVQAGLRSALRPLSWAHQGRRRIPEEGSCPPRGQTPKAVPRPPLPFSLP